MRAIINRLRRPENAAVPAERERSAAEAILEARRRRLGPDYEEVKIPPEIYKGCRDVAERINRVRRFMM